MSDESIRSVALIRAAFDEAFKRGDIDMLMRLFAPEAVWDASLLGMGTFEGADAIRAEVRVWLDAYDEFEHNVEEFQDFGHGIGFSVSSQTGRPVGSTGHVQQRQGSVLQVEDGMIVRLTLYADPDDARAAAERLAQERG